MLFIFYGGGGKMGKNEISVTVIRNENITEEKRLEIINNAAQILIQGCMRKRSQKKERKGVY